MNLAGDTTASVACAAGAFSFDVTASIDGTYNYSLSQTDGNLVSNQSTIQWISDTVAPSNPTITTPASSSVINNTTSLTVFGACETGATVNISGSYSSSMVCVSSHYSFIIDESSGDGIFNFSVAQTDPSGNSSGSTSLQWTLITSISTPTITSPALSPYYSSGSSLIISGACTTGATVALAGDVIAGDMTTPAGSLTTSCASSAYTFVVNKSVDATYNFSVSQTDAATNVSDSVSTSWVRNSSIPAAPTVTTPASSPYYSSGSSVTIAGACITGDTVFLTGADSQSVTCAGSHYSFTSNKSVDGNYSYNLNQETVTHVSSSSTTFIWVRETFAPAPVITAPSPTGIFTSADTTISVQGACEVGATVTMAGDGSGTTTCSVGGTFSINYTNSTDGTYNLSFTQTDLAGNVSAATSFSWTRNTTVPANPTITMPSVAVIYTNSSSITISGGCITSNTVTLSGADNQTFTCASNAYSFTTNQATDGTYLYGVSQTDYTTLVSSGQTDVTWSRLTASPSPVTIATPSANPYIASGNSVTISGACTSGDTVTLSGSDSQTYTCAANAYSFVTSNTIDATYDYSLDQTDLAGNVSSSTDFQWQRDSSVPVTPSITSPAPNPTYSNASVLTVAGGNCTPGFTVTLGGVLASAVTSPASSLTQTCSILATFSYTLSLTLDATYNFTVKQTSLASIDSGSASVSWIRNTVIPTASFTVTPPATNYTGTANFTFSSSKAGTNSFRCSVDNVTYTSCVSPYALTYTTAQNGSKTFYVKTTDQYGNTSAAASYTWAQNYYYTIGLFHLEADGTDSGSYANTMTAVGSPTYAAGKMTNAVTLSTTPKFLYRANNASEVAGNSTMTVEGWVKFSTTPSSTSRPFLLMSKTANSTSNLGWAFGAIKGSSSTRVKLVFWGSTTGTSFTKITASTQSTVATGTWYHMAATFNKGTVSLYFNGTKVGSGTIGTAGSAVIFSSSADLAIGANSTAGTAGGTTVFSYLSGSLDEVRLSQNIRYSANFTPATTAFTGD